MVRRRGNHEPGQHDRRRAWTVLTPGGWISRTRHVPAQAWTFRDRKRAQRLASNIRGARVSGPRRPRGCLWWIGVLFAIALVIVGLSALTGGLK